MKAFASWSGGKDCALALYRSMAEGHHVLSLLNFTDEEGRRSRSHGIRAELIRAQAEALGISLMQRPTSWSAYEQNFKAAVLQLKQEGVEAGIFGDMDVAEHRQWVERVCAELGIHPLLPLWQGEPLALLREFLDLGFRALVVASRFGTGWLGQELSEELAQEIAAAGAHPLGENGEYHTFVTDGPVFKWRLEVELGHVWCTEDCWLIDLALGSR